ncbi:MAG: YidB family protein [Casimicrobiaceae bacterium]
MIWRQTTSSVQFLRDRKCNGPSRRPLPRRATMGLLDGLRGKLMGGVRGGLGNTAATGDADQGSPVGGIGQSALLLMALQMIQQNGGLPGILGKLRQSGLGEHADSWVGTGANMPVSGDKLSQVLGSGAIGRIAEQCGVPPGVAAGGLAQMLPQIINQLTPAGQVPDNHGDLLSQAMAALARNKA